MFEKVNPNHPDKVADRIAGAIVDLAYLKNSHYMTLPLALTDKNNNPRIAVEVLIGHGQCTIIAETSVVFDTKEIYSIVERIAGEQNVSVIQVAQDEHLAKNQDDGLRCGDNGIFVGCDTNAEENELLKIAKANYRAFKSDGKYIIDKNKIVICQSNASNDEIKKVTPLRKNEELIINPLGEWNGGTNVDTGATNRKLGSDMGRAVTGGGLHGKDLSKADVSINIYMHLMAKKCGKMCNASCAIGDTGVMVNYSNKQYLSEYVEFTEIVNTARDYIYSLGGFEKLAEWGLIR